MRTARARLADALVGEQSLARMAQRVLEFLVNYLGAQAGTMYVAEPSGAYSRVAAIGVDAAAQMPTAVTEGDGLLGRAIVERKALRIENLPADYLKVGSGLGSRKPHALLIAPLVVDETAHGVLELGFLHPTFDSDLDLLAGIGEPIAIAIRTGMLRRERENLLQETQRQAEELQAQQEELRVANEELLSQSAQLRESQARLETQQAELEQTNVQLEEHAQKLGQQHDDLIGAKLDLERKAAELVRANRYKSEFLANMSHELRTPLNSSLILAKLLADNRDANLTPEQVKFARGITSAGNDLLALINDILDLSKIEARKIDLTHASIDLGELGASAVQTLRAHGAREADPVPRDTRRRTCRRPSTPTSQRLSQILKNLLSNAHQVHGARRRGAGNAPLKSDKGDSVEFAVRDTGIGIAAEHQQVIFEPFRQADGTTNRKFGGTGLGLSISRELARLLGGNITLESTPGEGSVFRLILPRSLPESRLPATTWRSRQRFQPCSLLPMVADHAAADAPARRGRRCCPTIAHRSSDDGPRAAGDRGRRAVRARALRPRARARLRLPARHDRRRRHGAGHAVPAGRRRARHQTTRPLRPHRARPPEAQSADAPRAGAGDLGRRTTRAPRARWAPPARW